ncbi:alpha/beta fold hydrolase [Nannocystis radixulma]|uniref:Alpha/beta hydrolase n=1 Tax=Nannocystis radixulma TaxID=2995305 RepID=A0ABT5BNB4_9BACT|nr:alpha/beta hydrolase [Nannocystis radixulma]MDC0674999.1 alpha/beta hydrolase [Nannocystis radixulma]
MLTPRGERLIDIGGIRLAALCFGPEDGVPVLAMHGWLDNAASFERLAEHLHGVNLVALDLAGHGLSQRRADGVYVFLDYVADASLAISALGWSRCVVVGHSLGAGVAALLAGTCPEQVARLVLLEGLGPLTNPDEAAPRQLRDALQAEAAARARDEHSGYASAEQVAERLASATGMCVDSARILLRRGLEPHDGRVRWRADPHLRLPSRQRLTEAQVRAFFTAITCPTLVVRAVPGMAFDEVLMRERLAMIGGAVLAEVPGGHHAHLDDPAAVAAIVGPFVSAV